MATDAVASDAMATLTEPYKRGISMVAKRKPIVSRELAKVELSVEISLDAILANADDEWIFIKLDPTVV